MSNPRDDKANKVLEYLTGFVVAPTGTDFMNASLYASDVINKEACESRPDLYTWVPSKITRYPCPEGLTCNTGVCKFKQDACEAEGELPFYDCVKRTVTCDTHPSGLCEICDYKIQKGHTIVGPYIPAEESAPNGCWAGDEKYKLNLPYPHPLEAPLDAFCGSTEECGEGAVCVTDPEDVAAVGKCVVPCTGAGDCISFHPDATCGLEEDGGELAGRCFVPNPPPDASACPGMTQVEEPYTVWQYDNSDEGVSYAESHPNEPWPTVEARVPCVMDEQCQLPPGVGGLCGRDPSLESYGYCTNYSTPPYLEWRDEVQMWDGLPPSRNVCVETMPYMRKWCEMPWTRTGMNEDDPTLPLSTRVKLAWKSKARPPFWYDERDSTCHVTKTYCEANLKNGGFSAGYGRARDYWLGSTCSGGNSREITGAYDCCTKLGDSIGEFFLGRTLTTDFRELVEGDTQGFGERWENYVYERSGLKDAWNSSLVKTSADKILREAEPDLAAAFDFVSDPRLKDNLTRQEATSLPGGVYAYSWTWSEAATRVYGLEGRASGLITSEVVCAFPECVARDVHGYDHLIVPSGHDIHRVLTQLGAQLYAFLGPDPAQAQASVE